MDMPSPPLFGVSNNNWLEWAQAYTEGIINPDSIGLPDYLRMYETDDVIYSCTEYIKRAVIKGLGEYVNFDEDQQDFVRAQLKQMKGSFLKKCEAILTAPQNGFSVTEIIWKELPGGSTGLGGLQTLHPKSITFDLHRDGPLKNDLKWCKQWWRQSQWERDIPLNKAIILTHGEHFGSPYGCSDYRRAWKLWKAKEILLKAYLITLERYGSPLALATPSQSPGDKIKVDGKVMEVAKYLTACLDSLAHKGSMVVPPGTMIEIIKHQGGPLGKDFLDALIWLNEQMQLALGMPKLITGTGQVGSHTLGIQQADNFKVVTDGISDELTEALIEQLIKQLIVWEFGPQDDYGLFLCENFDAARAGQLAEVAKKLKEADIIDTQSLDDVNFFREEIGLDPWTQEELDALADRTQVFPGMPPMPGQPPVPGADVGKPRKPDSKAISFSGKRKRQAFARRELQRRILREVMRAAA